jgi:hypothetical protein
MRSASSAGRDTAFAGAPIAACRVCGARAGEVLLEFPAVPVNCSELHHSAAGAIAAPTGSLRLVLCPTCGYVCNQDFDPAVLTYDAAYENALDFSPSFRADLELPESVEIFTELFDPATATVRGDLYCARHALEHIPEPLAFLRNLRPAVAEGGATLYLEVPAGEAVFGGDASFDLVYPHVSYFSAPALAGLLGRAGFAVDRIDHRFGGQYLSVEARADDSGATPVAPETIAAFAAQARDAAVRLDQRLDAARVRIDAAVSHERETALWGAGAKAVTFLALLDRDVDAVVDINPRKLGSFMPGSGAMVGAPATLVSRQPEVVFVLNPMYREEIAEMLAADGVTAEVVVV